MRWPSWKQGNRSGGKGKRALLLLGKQSGDLLARGAVDAHIGHGLLPVAQKLVFRAQALEGAPAQGIALEVTDPALGLAFVFRGSGPTGQQGAAVVPAKAHQLGVEFRIAPVGLLHRGAQVVEIQNLGDAPEGAKRILQTTDEVLGGLVKDRFAVSLARVAQDHAQDPGPTAPAIGIDHRGPGAKINCDLLARLDLDAPHPLGLLAAELAHEPFDRLIGAAEAHFGHQVLVNPLRAQARVQLGLDPRTMRITETGPARFGLPVPR